MRDVTRNRQLRPLASNVLACWEEGSDLGEFLLYWVAEGQITPPPLYNGGYGFAPQQDGR